MKISVRPEKTEDIPEIERVCHEAFGSRNEAYLVELLRFNEAFIPELSLVAYIDGMVVGHVLFSRISIVGENGKSNESLALAPMSVLPSWQRKGVGSSLIKKGLFIAKELHFKSVIVLGHETYYPKFGFVPASKWNIKAPFEVPENAFMALELVSGGLKGVSGTVVYPEEFGRI